MYKIIELKCNGLEFPRGMTDTAPEFSWKLVGDGQDVWQTQYRIRVWHGGEMVWDTDWISSDVIFGITYRGEPLLTGEYYHWQVESRNNHGQTAKSDYAEFLLGIMQKDFWQAKWIEADVVRKPILDCVDAGAIFSGQVRSSSQPEKYLDPAVYLRREFRISGVVKKARIYATAHGIYELQLDGQPISQLLAPEYTSYAKHLEVQTYDVTDKLTAGQHGIGCILADGWYTGKIGLMGVGNQYGENTALLMQMEIEYCDGRCERLVTDEEFRWSYGAYIYADLFVGEYYDAAAEPIGFSMPGFDDSNWQAVRVQDYGYANLQGQSIEPAAVLRKIKPVLRHSVKGEWILDAGENIVGFTGFHLKGRQRQEISLEHSEVLTSDGCFLQNIMGQNKNQKDRYICADDSVQQYCPKFTFHGFRYVRICGLEQVRAEDFTIYVVGTPLQRTGQFRTSHVLLNRLQENIQRSQQGNMLSLPTDCPQRERAGWTGDMQVYAPTAVFNMDVLNFLKRWLKDMRLEQRSDGQIPNVIPTIDSNCYIDGDREQVCSAGWGDACIIVPYRLYQAYGDLQVLRDNFAMMEKWLTYVIKQLGKTYLWNKGFHFGDWLTPSILQETGNPMETAFRTKEEAATAMAAYTTDMMQKICLILGEKSKADYYRNIRDNVRKAFSQAYIKADGSMREPLQGLYVLALQMEMAAESQKALVIKHLVHLIHANGDCLDTGFLSVPFLLDVLCQNGEKELAYTLLYQEKAPSWLYEVKQGATTLWERWRAIQEDGTRTDASYNHFAFGCVGDFLYRHIGGIELLDGGRQIRIAPDLAECGLEWAETVLDSAYGIVSVAWQKRAGEYCLQITLPPNTIGTLEVGGEIQNIKNGYTALSLPVDRKSV